MNILIYNNAITTIMAYEYMDQMQMNSYSSSMMGFDPEIGLSREMQHQWYHDNRYNTNQYIQLPNNDNDNDNDNDSIADVQYENSIYGPDIIVMRDDQQFGRNIRSLFDRFDNNDHDSVNALIFGETDTTVITQLYGLYIGAFIIMIFGAITMIPNNIVNLDGDGTLVMTLLIITMVMVWCKKFCGFLYRLVF